MTASSGSVMIEDYDHETSTVNVNLQDYSDVIGNFLSISQDLDEIKDAVITVIRGKVRHTNLSFKFPESSAAVTDVEAAREGKWLVSYRDTTEYLGAANTVPNPGFNQVFTFEIPTAKRSLLPADKDELDLTDTVPAAFVTGIESNIRSPYNRSAASPSNKVLSVRYVGRNI